MNERIKELRKILNLSQDEFGYRLGVTNTAISGYESGRRNPTEQIIKSICREFNVNEEWFRNGDGDIFNELLPEDEYTAAAAEISKSGDKLAMQAVIEYWKLDKESKKLLRDFIVHIVENTKNKE